MPKVFLIRFSILFALLFFTRTSFGYIISGQIKNVNKCYYPKAYLEVIKNIDGFFSSSPSNIIASAQLDKDGRFVMKGGDLPEEKLFYRLYFNENAAAGSTVMAGYKRNYILLLLNNESDVQITCEDFCKNFFSYTVANSKDNEAIASLQDILNMHGANRNDSMSVAKKEFVVNSEIRDIRNFIDTNSHILVNIYALTETDISENYYSDKGYYDSMLVKMQEVTPLSVYTKQYKEKLELLSLQKQIKEGKEETASGITWMHFVLIFSVILNIAFTISYFLKRKNKPALLPDNTADDEARIKTLIETLSIKEREILMMLHKGLSNKEIADNLNIEISTVKTHVSRIYQKTGISNRKEVASVAKYL